MATRTRTKAAPETNGITSQTEGTIMAGTTTITLTTAQANAVQAALAAIAEAFGSGTVSGNGQPAPAAVEVEVEDDGAARKAELGALTLAALKKTARDMGFEEEGVKDATKVELIDAIYNAEADAEEEADDDTDEEEVVAEDDDDEVAEDDDDEVDEADEAEEEAPDYDVMASMAIRALRKFVTDTWGDVSDEIDIAKASKEDILGWAFPDDLDDDDEAEEADEDEDVEEAEAEEEEEPALTEEELNAMSIGELRKVVKDYGGTPKPTAKKGDLIKLISDLADVTY